MTRVHGTCRRLLAALLCPLALVVGGTTTSAYAQPVPAEARNGVSYAALGDSVSSGQGAGSYDPSSPQCLRSARAYPALWAARHHPDRFLFAACSGATTSDVINKQLPGVKQGVTLVSITAGVNDIGLRDVLTACTLGGDQICLDHVARARTAVERTLPARLDAVYRAIRERAPRARVVVLGIPRPFTQDGCPMGLMTGRSERALNEAAVRVNAVTRERALAHGLAFGDVVPAFTGHEICSGHPWIGGLSLLHPDGAYHPNEAGQHGGYLPVLDAVAGQ
ncbi:SGNH/GDSL hydrolase family protein [Streptomyces orinoci]|uniref:SGNH/GDSL hydrolase family protein n=1 Tax=Streptomyces orinoci TaxID=67339 RepID=A0ABV3JYX7_STRON|nr:SGNH/GDSL hydrolase family protein [Streptomyces orinoci]